MKQMWHQCVIKFHELDNADNPGSLKLGNPATESTIAELEKSLGLSLPREFHEFYKEIDGFGTSRGDTVRWFFLPLEKLPAFTASIRDTFRKTHPELANRFVAFVDWENGDASGYLLSELGVIEGIFMFEHESYEYDPDQDWREFLHPVDDSIRSFLTE